MIVSEGCRACQYFKKKQLVKVAADYEDIAVGMVKNISIFLKKFS